MDSEDVSQILQAINLGEEGAETRLLELVHLELKRIAAARLRDAPGDHSLSPTALVNEAYIKLFGNKENDDWNGRGHFFSAAARGMRQILIDHARTKHRQKRGGDRLMVELDLALVPNIGQRTADEILSVDEALKALAEEDPKLAELVELKFFGGHTTNDAAQFLGISLRTANRDWQYSKARLIQLLGQQEN